MQNSSNISIIILAAGASKRMKTPKQLLKWGNSTLLIHAIETALNSHVKDVIVVLGANFELIKKDIEQLPITILNNKNWELGLGKSLAFGVDYLIKSKPDTEACLVTLADQPLIDATFINDLIDVYKENKQTIMATSYNDKKTGVPVIFDKTYFEELSLLNDDKGAKHILEKYKSEVKTLKPELENVDLDLKADYDKLYKEMF